MDFYSLYNRTVYYEAVLVPQLSDFFSFFISFKREITSFEREITSFEREIISF